MSIKPELKISVIIPVYNGLKYIKSAINSVTNQSLSPHELIIIDDGSTDDSIKSIEGMHAPFPIKIYRQKNAGQSSARNYGAKISNGDYLAFLDQDDNWYPDHLEKLAQPFLQIWRLGWSYSNLDEIDENGRLIQIGRLDSTNVEHPKKSIVAMLGKDMFILPSASLIRKQAFHEIGGFDEQLCGYEDDDLFMRLFVSGWRNCYIPESLSQWRIYSGSTSYTDKMDRSRMIYARKLLKQYPDTPALNKYWSRDYIIPRFLKTTMYAYLFNCIKIKNFQSCYQQFTYLCEYINMLPKQYQKKWKRYALILKSPRTCLWIWDNIIFHLPRSWKQSIRGYFS